MEKLLSVVVPTYNMEALLPRCLDSFILEKEDMDMLEIIVVNDGSKDNSSKIAHEYADKYPNTYIVIDKPNGNYGSCINAALKIATGRYFRICDSDDHYNNAIMLSYIKFLISCKTDIVFSPFKTIIDGTDKSKTMSVNKDLLNQSFNFCTFNGDLISEYFVMHCITVKREVLSKNHYFQTEGISYTDSQYAFYSLLYSRTFSFFKECVYIYHVGRDGQTITKGTQIRSYMNFYINAERMLNDYVVLPKSLPINISKNIINLIATVSLCYTNIVLGYKKASKEDIKRINTLLEQSKKSVINCNLEVQLMRSRYFRLWKKYHIPQPILLLMNKISSLYNGK